MKKRLSITLIGLLSIFIYSFSMAENIDKATTTSTESTTKPASGVAQPAKIEVEGKLAKEKVALPAILGDSILLYSLRGNNDVDELSSTFPNRRIMVVDGGIDVNFEDQPPMIPHSIDKARISLQENSCLKCHSKEDSKLEDAPRPPKSHFRKRDGSRSEKVSAGRYFCTQCHVSQANKKPAVKNLYKN
jgi:cytochrome c-type protein NapB